MNTNLVAKIEITINAPADKVWNALTDSELIKEYLFGTLILTTYWSSMSGLPDTPENYKKVKYELTSEGDSTKLTLTQDNNLTEEDKNHSEQNWQMPLDGLKKLLTI